MLVRRSWPSRPAFDNAFADFEHLRREMQRLLDHPTFRSGSYTTHLIEDTALGRS